MKKTLAVELSFDGNLITHYRVTGDGTKPITVRTGVRACGVFTCLTCLRVDCEHVFAAIEYDRARLRTMELSESQS